MKKQILLKAREMFLNLGFKSVTMDDLAQEIAISKKTIYSHFKNKEALVKEVSMDMFTLISEGIDMICAFKKDPIEELYEIKKFVLQHLEGEKSSPQYQLQKYYPKVYHILKQKQFELMQNCMVLNIKRGISLGIYREYLNVEFVSRIYFTGITSIKDQTLFPLKQFPPQALMDEYLEYHLRGIVTPKGQKKLNTIIYSNQK